MTLWNLALKNIRGNLKTYLIYFISMLFSITIYFVFVSLEYSDDLGEAMQSDELKSAFFFASILLILFIYIFIWYSNKYFSTLRKKEIALYSLLGMPKRRIALLLFSENLIMGILVLLVGILVGSFFTKLFSMILVNLLELNADIGIVVSLSAIINTFVVFIVISLINSLQSYRIIYKFKLIDLFNSRKEKEKEPKTSVLISIVSVILIAIGYYYASLPFEGDISFFLHMGIIVISLTVGTILFFIFLTVTIFKYLRKKNSIYYHGTNIITISNLVYRMRSYALTLSTVSILVAITLLAFTFGFGSYFTSISLTKQEHPYSYYYHQSETAIDQQIEQIIENDDAHPIEEEIDIPFLEVPGSATSQKIISGREQQVTPNFIKVVSETNFNSIAKKLNYNQLEPLESTDAVAIQPLYTQNKETDYLGQSITITPNNLEKKFMFTQMITDKITSWSYPDIVVIINDQEYSKLHSTVDETLYQGFNVEEPETTRETSAELEQLNNDVTKISTYYDGYRTNLDTGGTNIFIFTFLGLVFILSTGSILYFKQISAALVDKERYLILRKIGVSETDLIKTILKENFFIFALPVLIGSIHFAVLAGYLRMLVSNLMLINLTLTIFVCISIFLVAYLFYYFLTVNSYLKITLNYSFRNFYFILFACGLFILAISLLFIFT